MSHTKNDTKNSLKNGNSLSISNVTSSLRELQRLENNPNRKKHLYDTILKNITPLIDQNILIVPSKDREDIKHNIYIKILEILNRNEFWLNRIYRAITIEIDQYLLESNKVNILLDEDNDIVVQYKDKEPWALVPEIVYNRQDKWLLKYLDSHEKLILFLKFAWGLNDTEVAFNLRITPRQLRYKMKDILVKLRTLNKHVTKKQGAL